MVDELGQQLGILATREALALARERGLDLVEVAPTSDPPVCRLLDYGKFKYLQSTKEREMRKANKTTAVREVRFHTRIGAHDMEAKERVIHRLLDGGAKVKVSVIFRGREREHPEIGVNLLRHVTEELKDSSKLEQAPNMEGRFLSIVLAPVKATAKVAARKSAETNGQGDDAKAEDA